MIDVLIVEQEIGLKLVKGLVVTFKKCAEGK
jgi:hypothetical protein